MEGLVSVAARMSGPARILNYHMLAVARSPNLDLYQIWKGVVTLEHPNRCPPCLVAGHTSASNFKTHVLGFWGLPHPPAPTPSLPKILKCSGAGAVHRFASSQTYAPCAYHF